MALIVQKFGGSSVKDAERIREVAARVIEECDRGNQTVVAVSAMGKTTDNLIKLAHELTTDPPAREMDMLLSTGEQVSIAMLSIALHSMGRKAISLTGPQVGIKTDNAHGKARIVAVNASRMRKALDAGNVVVVAGFQGETAEEEITTLGRGGSDTTAVALAAALKADRCDIFTDVDGVYTADPRAVPAARLLDTITYDEMLELASLGAKVLHGRSVELAKNFRVPLRVLNSYSRHPGTLLVEGYENMEGVVVNGVAGSLNEIRVTMVGVPDRPGIAAEIFSRLGESNISVDMIIQNLGSNGKNDISFTVGKAEAKAARAIADDEAKKLGAAAVSEEASIAKLSVVGVGMRSHSGVAARMFRALAAKKINIKSITTSEITISCLIDADRLDEAMRAVHTEFGLDGKTEQHLAKKD